MRCVPADPGGEPNARPRRTLPPAERVTAEESRLSGPNAKRMCGPDCIIFTEALTRKAQRRVSSSSAEKKESFPFRTWSQTQRWATDATLPWTADRSRTTLFFRFTPQGTAWSAEYFDAAEYAGYPDMDARKLARLEPPNGRYAGRDTEPDGKLARL